MASCHKNYNGNAIYASSVGIPIEYCPPDHLIKMSEIEYESLPNYLDNVAVTTCYDTAIYSPKIIEGSSYPCADPNDVLGFKPVEFFTAFNIKPGYVEHPSFSNFEEYFVMSQEQIDFILTAMLVMTCCLAWCFGFSANEASAK